MSEQFVVGRHLRIGGTQFRRGQVLSVTDDAIDRVRLRRLVEQRYLRPTGPGSDAGLQEQLTAALARVEALEGRIEYLEAWQEAKAKKKAPPKRQARAGGDA